MMNIPTSGSAFIRGATVDSEKRRELEVCRGSSRLHFDSARPNKPGTVTGTVLDPTGAVIEWAHRTLAAAETGVRLSVEANRTATIAPKFEVRGTEATIEFSGESSGLLFNDSGLRGGKVLPDGTVITTVGRGAPGYSGDRGPAVQAHINPSADEIGNSLALDASGNLYVVDEANNVVRVRWSVVNQEFRRSKYGPKRGPAEAGGEP